MLIAANVLVALVAALHVYFLMLEMFFWTKPFGRKVFKLSAEKARDSAVLAANQGLYNGFLAAGLLVGLAAGGPIGDSFKLFFLACAVVAGAFGGATVKKRIFLIQGVPALVALALLQAGL